MSAQILELEDCNEVAEVLLAKPSRGIRYFLLALVALLVGAAGWAHCTKVSLVVRAPGRVRTIAGPVADLASGGGEAVVARVAGRVVEARAQEGDRVRAGDLLVRLDSTKIDNELAKLEKAIEAEAGELSRLERMVEVIDQQEEAAVAKLRAEVQEVEIAFAQARGAAEGMRALVAEGLEPAQKVSAALAEQERTEARLRTARGQEEIVRKEFRAKRSEHALRIEAKRGSIAGQRWSLKNLRLDREACEIRAHADGIVTQGRPREGDYVEAGKSVLAIARESGFRVDVAVPASEIGLVRVGMKAKVKLDAYDYRDYGSLEGTVVEIAPDSQVVDKAVVYMARVRLEDGRAPVKLGMTALVEIVTGEERATKLLFRKVRERVSL